jgi:catechol 2,3-dioxygenase-like lactoylglutathione lyase family enzyme
MTRLQTEKLVAFAATSDASRARRFYGDTLGLRLVAHDPFALAFDANGTELRLQKVSAVTPLADASSA